MEKTIIVNGANGYIASRLIPVLLEKFEVIALANNRESILIKDSSNLKKMSNEEFFNESFDESDYILLNLAFPRKNDPILLFQIFQYTYKLYKKAKEIGCRKIINISSQSVYDKDRITQAFEDDLLHPFNLYGLAKIYIEKYTKTFSKKNDINFLNLRLGSIVGPNFEIRDVNKITKLYVSNQDINIDDEGFVYSFINVYDCVSGLFAIIDQSEKIKWNEIYNLGVEFEYGVKDIVNSLKSKDYIEYNSNIQINEIEKKNKTNKISVEKLKNNLDWNPKFDLEETIKNILVEEYNIKR